MKRVLVLGGSALTEGVAQGLAGAGFAVSVYWSRAPLSDAPSAASTLRAGLDCADVLVDTTHPFDDPLRDMAIALAPHLPRVRVARPAWQPMPQDNWIERPTLAEAVAAVPPGACVFAASGRDSAEVLAHHDGPVFLRQLHCHDDPAPDGCVYVFGDGPFDVDNEMALFQELGIDVLLARNMGGARGFPKLAAARALKMPVVLIAAPPTGIDLQFADAEALLAWITAQ